MRCDGIVVETGKVIFNTVNLDLIAVGNTAVFSRCLNLRSGGGRQGNSKLNIVLLSTINFVLNSIGDLLLPNDNGLVNSIWLPMCGQCDVSSERLIANGT